MRTLAVLVLILGLAPATLAQTPGGQPSIEDVSRAIDAKVQWKTGKVAVGTNAEIDLPAGYRFAGPQDARFIVEEVWGNPPDTSVLGLVMPVTERTADSWAVIVTFEAEGYVKDSDAAETNFDEVLKSLQEGSREANPARKKAGYPTMDLLGWAEPPHYDAATKKLYWCKRLKVEGSTQNTLNYDVRVLGRSGFLQLTAVAGEPELADVRAGCQQVLAGTEFKAGQRYADYKPGIDKEAAYGIGGLVLGGVVAAKLAKGGLLVKLAKPLIIGAVALFAVLGKLFGKKSPEAPAAA